MAKRFWTEQLLRIRKEPAMYVESFKTRKSIAAMSKSRMPGIILLRTSWLTILVLIAGFGFGTVYAGQQQGKSEQTPNGKTAKESVESGARRDGAVGATPSDEPMSDAERMARLQRAIADNEKLLGELRAKRSDPQDEYAKAEAEFSKLDRYFQDKKRELQKQKDAGTADTMAIETELAALEPQWKLAKERFDLAIKARKTIQEQVATLEQKIRQDQEAVKKLTEVKPSTSPPEAPATSPPATQDGAGPPASPPAPTPSVPASPAAPSAGSPPKASGLLPGSPALNGAEGQPAPASQPVTASPPSAGGKPGAPSPMLIQAQKEAGKRESAAAEAEEEAQSVTERVEALHKSIELERSLLVNARNRADNAQEMERTLDDDLQRRWSEGADKDELDDLRRRKAEAHERFREARAEIQERTDRLDTLQSDLGELQAEEIAAMRAAAEKRTEAEAARKKVESLQNPFAPRNVLQWTIDHGPRILLILLGMAGIVWIARLMERRITDWMAHHGKARITGEDENRAKTLVGVFHNAIRVVVLLGGLLMILAEADVNIIPLMGGAAVLGLAAAFGGQNLLRDYFTGFMILMENQYAVNDVVRIGEAAGLVERITLRLTVLRDLDGKVHFIPNGHIVTVTNLTHGWSRALFNISVAYKEDVDRVMEVLLELGKELRRDLDYRHMILEQPEMLGVDQFGDSAVIIKFYIKTRPLMQWTVKREMLRRIKKKFDELGIEIPFPHRTLYHRYEPNTEPDDPQESFRAVDAGEPNR